MDIHVFNVTVVAHREEGEMKTRISLDNFGDPDFIKASEKALQLAPRDWDIKSIQVEHVKSYWED